MSERVNALTNHTILFGACCKQLTIHTHTTFDRRNEFFLSNFLFDTILFCPIDSTVDFIAKSNNLTKRCFHFAFAHTCTTTKHNCCTHAHSHTNNTLFVTHRNAKHSPLSIYFDFNLTNPNFDRIHNLTSVHFISFDYFSCVFYCFS